MKFSVVFAALAGLAGAAYLVFVVGFDAVLGAIEHIGWLGFGLLWLYGVANFLLLGTAWALLVPPYSLHDAVTFWWSRAVRDSAGDVLPFSQLGGMLIGARAGILRGLTAPLAFGAMVVDVTIELVAQIAFITLGLVLILIDLPMGGQQTGLLEMAAGAAATGLLAAGGFIVAQRRGFTMLERIARRMLPKAAPYAGEMNRVIAAIYARPPAMVAGFALHFAGWIGSGFATWLALQLIGRPLAFADALAIEAVMCALRSAVVFVPGAYGVQEAGYALIVPLFGLPAPVGLAVSLLKRAREIAVGAPVIVSWQLAEGGHAARTARLPEAGA